MKSLKERRDFTLGFLLRKQIEPGEKDTKARTLCHDHLTPAGKEEKCEAAASLHLRVQARGEQGNPSTLPEHIMRVLTMRHTEAPPGERASCPLECDVPHPKGSMFCCGTFRDKTLKEKRAWVESSGFCRTCLRPQHRGEECLVAKCQNCKGSHSVMLCEARAEADASSVVTPQAASMPDDSPVKWDISPPKIETTKNREEEIQLRRKIERLKQDLERYATSFEA